MGGLAGTIDPGFDQSSFIIDYVRVFQEGTGATEDNAKINASIEVYPNPANDIIYLKADEPLTKLTIYDISGKHILTQKKPKGSINVSALKPGVYILEIYSTQEKSRKRIIIE